MRTCGRKLAPTFRCGRRWPLRAAAPQLAPDSPCQPLVVLRRTGTINGRRVKLAPAPSMTSRSANICRLSLVRNRVAAAAAAAARGTERAKRESQVSSLGLRVAAATCSDKRRTRRNCSKCGSELVGAMHVRRPPALRNSAARHSPLRRRRRRPLPNGRHWRLDLITVQVCSSQQHSSAPPLGSQRDFGLVR